MREVPHDQSSTLFIPRRFPMKKIYYWVLILSIIVGLQLSGCVKETTATKIQPFQLETIEGTDLKRVILTEKAVERLDIQTSPVREERVNGVNRKVVPYAAIIYDTQGQTWVYINPASLTFVRESVSVLFIDGDDAILVKGPSIGSEVVTVGLAELYGAETGVSK
jgi:hypothetical protein